jgi:hypothetical protein
MVTANLITNYRKVFEIFTITFHGFPWAVAIWRMEAFFWRVAKVC